MIKALSNVSSSSVLSGLLAIRTWGSLDSIGRVAAVAVSYLGLVTIEGQIIQPLFVGLRLALNPIIVFLALWFGGWFWGIAGIVMAVPALVALKVAAAHSQATSVVEFLSRDGDELPQRQAVEAKYAPPVAKAAASQSG